MGITPRPRTSMRLALALVLLLVAACGGAPGGGESPTSTAAPSTTTTPEPSMDDDAVTDDMEGMEDDGHEHPGDRGTREWDNGSLPNMSVSVVEGDDGYVAILTADGFSFSDPTDVAHVPGLGHTHVYVNGQLLGMFYEAEVALGDLPPGTHEVEVTLSAADHLDYTADGTIIGTSTMVEVAGNEPVPDIDLVIGFAGGDVTAPGNRVDIPVDALVHITITSDVADEVHLHGYDIVLDIEPGVPATLKFVADIQGIFELELEDSRVALIELKVQ